MSKIKNGAKKGIAVIAAMIMIVVLNCILLPCYDDFLKKDIELKITATGEKNEVSLSNGVRLYKLYVNEVEQNIGKIPLSGSWKYSEKDDFIYAYEIEKSTDLIINLEGVKSILIGVISDNGSGKMDISVNGKLWKKIDLYSDNTWKLTNIEYNSNILLRLEQHPVLVFIIALGTLLLLYRLNRKAASKWEKYSIIICCGFLLAELILLTVSLIQYQNLSDVFSLFAEQKAIVFRTTVFIYLLLLFLYFLFGKMGSAYLIVALLIEIMAAISNIKILNRGMPLLPWDYTMTGEVLSVIDNYKITISPLTLGCFWFTVLVFAVCLNIEPGIVNIKFRKLLAIPIFVSAIFFVNKIYLKENVETRSQRRSYQTTEYYNEVGFVTAYMESLHYLMPGEKPDGYSQETMNAISQTLNDIEITSSETHHPNIIVIMSESMWDVSRMPDVYFIQEPLPEYKKLREEGLSGQALSHVYWGGTVVSEFELLTGYSGEFFPPDYMVYGKYLFEGFHSAVSILQEQGYYTTAIHPYIKTNYNRDTAYRNLGFDQTLFENDFSEKSIKLVRDHISDESLFQKVTEILGTKEKDAPAFIFVVTMQNHGGYWGNTTYIDQKVDFIAPQYKEETRQCMEDYFAGLHESDRALGGLVEYIRNMDEETILVYFGDHMSNAGPNNEHMLEKSGLYEDDSLEEDFESHLVPFLIWSNYENKKEDLGIMEISQLLPTTFEKYELRMPKFWKFLTKLKDIYDATSQTLIVNSDMSYASLSEMDELQKNYYDQYHLLQYDYIWGEQYLDDVWKLDEG